MQTQTRADLVAVDRQHDRFGCLPSLLLLFITFGIAGALLTALPSELSLRSVGGGFQLLGIAAVALGIRDLRIEFKVPTWREDLRVEALPLLDNVKTNWRRWWRIRKHYTLKVDGVNISVTAGGSTTASGRLVAKRLPVDERVDMLAAELERVKADLEAANARHREQVTRDLATEAERRAEMKLELMGMITSLAVGGLRLETVGICWLLAGTVLTTWPGEIASLLGTVL